MVKVNHALFFLRSELITIPCQSGMKSQISLLFPIGNNHGFVGFTSIPLSFLFLCLPARLSVLNSSPQGTTVFFYRCTVPSVRSHNQLSVVPHTCNLSIQKAEMGGFPRV